MNYRNNKTQHQISGHGYDIDTLLRYQRKGIKLSEAQVDAIRMSGRSFEESPFERQERARALALEAMKTKAGLDAHEGGYYIEMFEYFYQSAVSQVEQGMQVYLTAPDMIPPTWKAFGEYRINSTKKTYKPEKPKEGAHQTPPEKTAMDLEIERQMAARL
jgi:hypothetical protein